MSRHERKQLSIFSWELIGPAIGQSSGSSIRAS